MAKPKKKQKEAVTNDELARMIARGFEQAASKEELKLRGNELLLLFVLLSNTWFRRESRPIDRYAGQEAEFSIRFANRFPEMLTQDCDRFR